MFHPLPSRRAFEEIIHQIEQAIADGRLSEGDRLPSERDLAETFGVSRTSVREALRVLEMFGVVVARRGGGPDSGSVVAGGTEVGLVSVLRFHSDLLGIPTADFVELRVLLEDHAVGLAARQDLTSDSIKPLRRLLERMHEADRQSWHTLDVSFHVALARTSGNALIPLLMEALRELMAREMLRGLSRLPDWQAERARLMSEHEAILEHIESHDADEAVDAVRSHIHRFYDQFMEGRQEAVGKSKPGVSSAEAPS